MTDWLLLFAISVCAMAAIFEKSRGVEIRPKRMFLSLVEFAILMLIIPTWGAWPAVCTLLINRLVKQLFDNDLILKRKITDDNERLKINHALASAIIPFLLICLVWTSFGQLTMLGLLEFNPTKWVVKSGLFGGGASPPVFWIILMSILPVFSSIILVLHSWLSTSRPSAPLFALIGFVIATKMSHLWLCYSYPQVMMMIGFSSIVIISWLAALAMASFLFYYPPMGLNAAMPRARDH
jgi:hypothetical protein